MSTGKRVFVRLTLVLGLTIVISIFGPALVFGVPFSITQITDNGHNDWMQQISGGNVVWVGHDGHDNEIFLWDGEETTQVTHNEYEDHSPQISGNNVVWAGQVDGPQTDAEIFFWDGEETTRVTDNQRDDEYPQISGRNIVWQGPNDGPNGARAAVFFWDGSEVTTVTESEQFSKDLLPQISGNNVVWQEFDDRDYNYEIFFWDGDETTQVTDNQYHDYSPQISGGNVVWHQMRGNSYTGYEIFFWNGLETTQVTDNQYNDMFPQISGGNLVWRGQVGGIDSDYEIFFWDGLEVTQVTDNQHDDWRPQISGNNIVWDGTNGQDPDIFFWDGSEVTTVTDNGIYGLEPQISGGNIVWMYSDGDDAEIYHATVGPDIDVSPLEYDFGDVAWGSPSTVIVTIYNTGGSDLVVSNLNLASGPWGTTYSIDNPPPPPITIPAEGTIDLQIRYTASSFGPTSAVLEIQSDDPDESVVEIALSGNGVWVEAPPDEQIQAILDFVEESVGSGSLVGEGSGGSANGRLNALRNMIEASGDLIHDEDIEGACQQLQDIYNRVDGVEPPPDFVSGDAAQNLASILQGMRGDLGCQ